MVHDLILDIGKTLDPPTVCVIHLLHGMDSRSVESTARVMFFDMGKRDVGHTLPHLKQVVHFSGDVQAMHIHTVRTRQAALDCSMSLL